jgi:hypothetical protein
MTIDIQAFQAASSYVISATAVTSNTALTQPTNPANPSNASYTASQGFTRIKVYNSSATVACFLQAGMASQTATTGSPMVVPPATWVTFELGGPYTNLGAIMASAGTVSIYVMLGNGY